jgi:hypothetical protein
VLRLAAVGILILGVATAAEPPARQPTPDPVANYDAHRRHSFKVMLNKRLSDGGPALQCLDGRLAEIVRVVPPAHLSLLRDVTFWIEAGSASEPALNLNKPEGANACYLLLDRDNVTAYGVRREKLGGIVIVDPIDLVEPSASRLHKISPG